MSMFESLNRVDWILLHRQKQALVECLDSGQVMPSRVEALRGIVELLDALQDDAEAAGLWAFLDE